MSYANLHEFAITKNNIGKFINMRKEPTNINNNFIKNNQQKNNESKNNLIKYQDDFFSPNLDDSLFWCWVIKHYGMNFYNINKMSSFKKENELKYDLMDKIMENKEIIKKNKFKFNHIQSDLQNKTISFEIFVVLCLMHGYNVILITDKLYYENNGVENSDKICFVKKEKDKYTIFLGDESKIKNEIKIRKEKLLIVDNINKPLKSVSAYKKPDILNICKVFNINIMKDVKKQKTKKELYQEISEFINTVY